LVGTATRSLVPAPGSAFRASVGVVDGEHPDDRVEEESDGEQDEEPGDDARDDEGETAFQLAIVYLAESGEERGEEGGEERVPTGEDVGNTGRWCVLAYPALRADLGAFADDLPAVPAEDLVRPLLVVRIGGGRYHRNSP